MNYDDFDFSSSRSLGYRPDPQEVARSIRIARRKAALLGQGEIWINRENRYIPIKEMSSQYCENTARFLADNVKEWRGYWQIQNGESTNLTDEEWLNDTPLYQALVKGSERPF